MLEKGDKMIYIKDGLTRGQMIELLQYSLEKDCLYTMAVKPDTNVVNDHFIQEGSVVRFLKVEEKTFKTIVVDGSHPISTRFNVKVAVEDSYWEELKDPTRPEEKDKFVPSGIVPQKVHMKVCKILFG